MRKVVAPYARTYLVFFGLLAVTVGVGVWPGCRPIVSATAIFGKALEQADDGDASVDFASGNETSRPSPVAGVAYPETPAVEAMPAAPPEQAAVHRRKLQRENPPTGPPHRRMQF